MGANPDDIWRIKEWTEAFFHRISLMLNEQDELASVRKEIEVQHYFQPIFEHLREHPDDTLLSVLLNRDERRFDNADQIDLERKNPGGHMAFGSGKHHCLGAPLARRELTWSFQALLDRVDEMWFAEGKNDFSYHPHYLLRSLKALHIGFRRA